MRHKHVPLRTCVACGARGPQREFVRVTRTAESDLAVGTAREVGGRGAYLCRRLECFVTGVERGAIERALRGRGSDRSRVQLMEWARAELTTADTA